MSFMKESDYFKFKVKENGFTLARLADILNISLPSLSLKVNGKRNFKNYEIKKILEVLNLRYEELFQVDKLELDVGNLVEVIVDGKKFLLDESTKDIAIDYINDRVKEVG